LVLRDDAVFLGFAKAVSAGVQNKKAYTALLLPKNGWFSGKSAVYAFCIGRFL